MAGRFLRERARQGWKLTTTEVPAGLPPHQVKGEMRWIALPLIFLWFDGHQMILPISRARGLSHDPLCLLRRNVAESRVDALPIVVAFDVGEQVASGLIPRRSSSMGNEFHVQGLEEASIGAMS